MEWYSLAELSIRPNLSHNCLPFWYSSIEILYIYIPNLSPNALPQVISKTPSFLQKDRRACTLQSPIGHDQFSIWVKRSKRKGMIGVVSSRSRKHKRGAKAQVPRGDVFCGASLYLMSIWKFEIHIKIDAFQMNLWAPVHFSVLQNLKKNKWKNRNYMSAFFTLNGMWKDEWIFYNQIYIKAYSNV